MIPQFIIYPRAVSFVINQHFEVQTVVSAGLADVGRCDSVITPLGDFLYGLFHLPAVGAYYFIDPPAGVLHDGLSVVFVWHLVCFNLPLFPDSLKPIHLSSYIRSIAEDGGKRRIGRDFIIVHGVYRSAVQYGLHGGKIEQVFVAGSGTFVKVDFTRGGVKGSPLLYAD